MQLYQTSINPNYTINIYPYMHRECNLFPHPGNLLFQPKENFTENYSQSICSVVKPRHTEYIYKLVPASSAHWLLKKGEQKDC